MTTLKKLPQFLTVTFGVCVVWHSTAILAADCGLPPEEPVIPDGTRISFDQLRRSSEAVRVFIESAGNYLVCVLQNRDDEMAPLDYEQQAAWLQRIEALTEARNTIADRFNGQVAAFQTANPEEYPIDKHDRQ